MSLGLTQQSRRPIVVLVCGMMSVPLLPPADDGRIGGTHVRLTDVLEGRLNKDGEVMGTGSPSGHSTAR